MWMHGMAGTEVCIKTPRAARTQSFFPAEIRMHGTIRFMTTSTRILLLCAAAALTVACSPEPARQSRLPVIYEQVSTEGTRDIPTLSQEPVGFYRGNLKIRRQDISISQVLPDAHRIQMRKNGNCGAVIAPDRLQRLHDNFSAATPIAYSLYPSALTADQAVYHILAVPNAVGYSTQKSVTDDFIDSCDVALFPLVAMNDKWLVFAGSPCRRDAMTDECTRYEAEIGPTIAIR